MRKMVVVAASVVAAAGIAVVAVPQIRGVAVARGQGRRRAAASRARHSGDRGHGRSEGRAGVAAGIGTVQAYNTVTIKSRVDGQIVKVSFQEGQDVKAGDPLFQIDPRPFQAALELAQAQKAKDEAQLAARRPISNATASSSAQAIKPRRATTSRRRWSPSCRRRSRATRRRSTPPSSISPTPTSARRSTAASARAWSMSATWCRPPTPAGWSRSPRSSRSSSTSPCRRSTCDKIHENQALGPLTVVAYGDDKPRYCPRAS